MHIIDLDRRDIQPPSDREVIIQPVGGHRDLATGHTFDTHRLSSALRENTEYLYVAARVTPLAVAMVLTSHGRLLSVTSWDERTRPVPRQPHQA